MFFNNIKVECAAEEFIVVDDDLDVIIDDPLIGGGFDEAMVLDPGVFNRDSPESPPPTERGISPRLFHLAEGRQQLQQIAQQLQEQEQEEQLQQVAQQQQNPLQPEEEEEEEDEDMEEAVEEEEQEVDSGFSDAETLEYVRDDGVDPDFIPGLNF